MACLAGNFERDAGRNCEERRLEFDLFSFYFLCISLFFCVGLGGGVVVYVLYVLVVV